MLEELGAAGGAPDDEDGDGGEGADREEGAVNAEGGGGGVSSCGYFGAGEKMEDGGRSMDDKPGKGIGGWGNAVGR